MFDWPNTETATAWVQVLPINPQNTIGQEYLPLNTTTYTESEAIKFEVFGPLSGRTMAHQLGQEVKLIDGPDRKFVRFDTAYWREAMRIDERDWLRTSRVGSNNFKRAGEQLFALKSYQLDLRNKVNIEFLRWKALDEGLTSFTENGVTVEVTYGLPAVVTLNTLWSDAEAALPVNDLQTAMLGFRGLGASNIDVVMNLATAIHLCQNEQVQDLVRANSLAGNIGPANISDLLLQLVYGNGGGLVGGARLKRIRIYDEGYTAANGTFTPFIPDGRVFLLGYSAMPVGDLPLMNNDLLGEFCCTPTVHGGFSEGETYPGFFMEVDDHSHEATNRYVNLVAGINGLPAIYRPTWVRRLQVL